MTPTPSQLNAQHCRNFVPTLHTTPYPAIDPSRVTLPSPFVVCIIGGRGAAGGGLARAYAQAGASGLILAARTRSGLEETANEVRAISSSIKVVISECDITIEKDLASIAQTVKSEFDGRLDVAVVNSGYSGPMILDVAQESPEDYLAAFNVNTIGLFYAAHHLLPLLEATQSRAMSFIAINSMATPTVAGMGGHAHYCVSKAAQARLIEMIYEQYSSRGLFCASVHPGGMMSGFIKHDVPENIKKSMFRFQFTCSEINSRTVLTMLPFSVE
jgi:NAD(P)-dependent dehydrogenase (short-subunit alcohol dehydrogenase family)